MFPLLVGLAVVVYIATRDTKKEGRVGPSAAEARLFVHVNGVLQYRPEVARLIILSLLERPYTVTPGSGGNVFIVMRPQSGPPEFPAYDMLEEVHAEGFDIYVPTNAHVPLTWEFPVLVQDPNKPPPPEGMARLIRPTQVWPTP